MGLRRDLTAGSRIELCRELRLPPIDPITLGPERLLRAFLFFSQCKARGNSRGRLQDLEEAPGEDISRRGHHSRSM